MLSWIINGNWTSYMQSALGELLAGTLFAKTWQLEMNNQNKVHWRPINSMMDDLFIGQGWGKRELNSCIVRGLGLCHHFHLVINALMGSYWSCQGMPLILANWCQRRMGNIFLKPWT
jgi:hypothetical protein